MLQRRSFPRRNAWLNSTLVNGHVEAKYSRKSGTWTAPKFVRSPYLTLHGLAPGLNYGQHALEGLKAFRMPGESQNIAIFRPDCNSARLQHSARCLSMPPVPDELFLTACRMAVAGNAEYVPPHETGAGLYIRPLLFGSSASLALVPPEEYTFTVFVLPTPLLSHDESFRALILDTFDRAAPLGTGHAKVGGNYAPVLPWIESAKHEQFGITLHLDSARHEEVDEFSTAGFVGILRESGSSGLDEQGDKITVVIPDSKCAIKSVTSRSVQQMAAHNGWKVEVRPIKYTELPSFVEVLGVGTSVGLVPVQSITRQSTTKRLSAHPSVSTDDNSETIQYITAESGRPGPIFYRLLAQLRGLQSGKLPDDFGWRHEIHVQDRPSSLD